MPPEASSLKQPDEIPLLDEDIDEAEGTSSDNDNKTGVNAADLLGSFKKTMAAVSEAPSWLSSAQALLPGDKQVPGQTTTGSGVERTVPSEQQRLGDRVIQHIGDSPNPVADLSAALRNLDNLRSATVTRRTDGKHQISMQFDQKAVLPAVDANIRGFRPGPTTVAEDISFTLSHFEGGIRLENMRGFSSFVTGPLGRRRGSWNNAMHIGRDQAGVPFVDVDSTVRGPFRNRQSSNRFREDNFPDGSPVKHLMRHPDALGDLSFALRMFQKTDDVKDVLLKKTAAGTFEIGLQALEAKTIPINTNIQKFGVTVESITLDKTLSASLSYDDKGVRLGDMKGISIQLKGLLGDLKVTPRTVALQNTAEGKPVVHIEIEHPTQRGTMMPFDIPIEKLKELSTRQR